MKKWILKLIAIKLSKEAHKTFSNYLSKVAFVTFCTLVSVGAFNRIASAMESGNMLDNGQSITLAITLEETYDDESTTFYYHYVSHINEVERRHQFFATKDMRKNWGDNNTIEFMYLPADPNTVTPLVILKNATSIGQAIKWFFLLLFISALSVWLFYAFITEVLVICKDKPEKPDEELPHDTAQ